LWCKIKSFILDTRNIFTLVTVEMASSEDKKAMDDVREEADGESSKDITVNVKTPKDKKSIKVDEKATIKEVISQSNM